MTVDVAQLVFEIDSTQAVVARKNLEGLEQAATKVDASVRKVRTASQMAGIGLKGAAEDAKHLVRSATELAAAEGIVESATRRAGAASAETRATRRLEAAAMREMVLAGKEYDREQAQLTARATALKASIDPLAGALDRVNKELAEASVLYARGKLDQQDYDRAQTVLTGRLNALSAIHGKAAGGAKLQAHELGNLGAQVADIGVSLASGQALWLVAIQQGSQVGQVFGGAAARGVSFGAALKQLGGIALSLVTQFGPLLAATAAVGGAFVLWKKHTEDVKKALEQTKKAVADFGRGQLEAAQAMQSAIEFTDKYGVANEGVSKALDGVLMSQSAAYRETLSGIGATDAAARSAAQRAEIERQLTVNILRKAAAEAEARQQTAKDAAKIADRAAFGSGLVTAMGLAGSPDAIAMGQARQAAEYRRLGGRASEDVARKEGELKSALLAQADAISKVTGLTIKATDVATAHAGAVRGQSNAVNDNGRATADYIIGLERELQAVGQTSNAVRRLAADREIEAALRRGDTSSGLHIKGLILEIEKYEELVQALEEVAKHRKSALEAINEPLFAIPQNVAFDKPDVVAELANEFDKAARAAADIRYAVDDVFYGIREKNWAAAFAGLFSVIKQLQLAFDKTADKSQRMGAVGGVLTGVGGAVGGKVGSAISAVGSGFSAAGSVGAAATVLKGMGGAAASFGGAIAGLAGPIGIAVAGFSLLSGILGDQKAKKRAKLEQEARDIENARATALEEANRQAELQLRILELSGDEVGALTRRREAELATLKGSSRALAEHVHALEDWVKAVDLAKDAVSKAQDDLRAAYEADKDRLNAIVAGVETARDRLNQAYQRERGVIEGTISSVRSLVDSLSAFRVEMDMMAAANDPSRQYGYASRQFATASNDNLVERGRAFAEASQSASATDLDFQRDLAAVRRRTDEASKTAQTQLTTAERQLLALDAMVIPLLGVNDNLLSVEEAIRGLTTAEQMALLATEELARLDAQVGALITINSSVLSVAQAISNLNGAISALASAQASKPSDGASGQGSQAVGLTGYVDKNADLAALYASGSGMAAGRTKEQFAAYHWERYGQAEGRTYTAFARGGDHTGGLRLVGEEGPELEATGPSRIYNARQTAQMLGGDTARLEALVETLTDKVEELTKLQRTDNFEIKRNTKDSADIMAKVTQGADTVRVKAA